MPSPDRRDRQNRMAGLARANTAFYGELIMSGCDCKLAPGQYFNFCGETDMGQTMPALCTHCGGSYKRANKISLKKKKLTNVVYLAERQKKQQKTKQWASSEPGNSFKGEILAKAEFIETLTKK